MDSSQPLSIESLARENENLKYEIAALKSLIEEIENDKNKSWGQVIDEKVETWFEKFKDDIDIGRIATFEAFGSKYEIDVLPDAMEKAIYKNVTKIFLPWFPKRKAKSKFWLWIL